MFELAKIKQDAVLVMHMLGSHGPDYYLRYPPGFARFTLECQSNTLQSCSQQEIINAYDNTIAYTDHVLADMIEQLQQQKDADVALLYVFDHGESTGESGFYLHGAPILFAPDQQTQVPMLFWASSTFADRQGIDLDCLKARRSQMYSHDNLFHSLLGMLHVESSVKKSELDIFNSCQTS